MKRNKIKQKYLYKILSEDKDNDDINNLKNTNQSFFDKIEHSIKMSLISFGIILLFLCWSLIPITILSFLGINYQNFSNLENTIFMFISELLFLLLLFIIYKKDVIKDFCNYFNRDWKKNLKLSFRYWGMGLLVMIISNYIIALVMNGELPQNEEAIRELIKATPLYMAFELMIYAPISEELVFRKSTRDIFKNRYAYALLSGLIFGGLHAITSVNSFIDLLYFVPYCSLGYVFALLYSKTNNIFSTITIHSIHNTIALVLYLVAF